MSGTCENEELVPCTETENIPVTPLKVRDQIPATSPVTPMERNTESSESNRVARQTMFIPADRRQLTVPASNVIIPVIPHPGRSSGLVQFLIPQHPPPLLHVSVADQRHFIPVPQAQTQRSVSHHSITPAQSNLIPQTGSPEFGSRPATPATTSVSRDQNGNLNLIQHHPIQENPLLRQGQVFIAADRPPTAESSMFITRQNPAGQDRRQGQNHGNVAPTNFQQPPQSRNVGFTQEHRSADQGSFFVQPSNTDQSNNRAPFLPPRFIAPSTRIQTGSNHGNIHGNNGFFPNRPPPFHHTPTVFEDEEFFELDFPQFHHQQQHPPATNVQPNVQPRPADQQQQRPPHHGSNFIPKPEDSDFINEIQFPGPPQGLRPATETRPASQTGQHFPQHRPLTSSQQQPGQFPAIFPPQAAPNGFLFSLPPRQSFRPEPQQESFRPSPRPPNRVTTRPSTQSPAADTSARPSAVSNGGTRFSNERQPSRHHNAQPSRPELTERPKPPAHRGRGRFRPQDLQPFVGQESPGIQDTTPIRPQKQQGVTNNDEEFGIPPPTDDFGTKLESDGLVNVAQEAEQAQEHPPVRAPAHGRRPSHHGFTTLEEPPTTPPSVHFRPPPREHQFQRPPLIDSNHHEFPRGHNFHRPHFFTTPPQSATDGQNDVTSFHIPATEEPPSFFSSNDGQDEAPRRPQGFQHFVPQSEEHFIRNQEEQQFRGPPFHRRPEVNQQEQSAPETPVGRRPSETGEGHRFSAFDPHSGGADHHFGDFSQQFGPPHGPTFGPQSVDQLAPPELPPFTPRPDSEEGAPDITGTERTPNLHQAKPVEEPSTEGISGLTSPAEPDSTQPPQSTEIDQTDQRPRRPVGVTTAGRTGVRTRPALRTRGRTRTPATSPATEVISPTEEIPTTVTPRRRVRPTNASPNGIRRRRPILRTTSAASTESTTVHETVATEATATITSAGRRPLRPRIQSTGRQANGNSTRTMVRRRRPTGTTTTPIPPDDFGTVDHSAPQLRRGQVLSSGDNRRKKVSVVSKLDEIQDSIIAESQEQLSVSKSVVSADSGIREHNSVSAGAPAERQVVIRDRDAMIKEPKAEESEVVVKESAAVVKESPMEAKESAATGSKTRESISDVVVKESVSVAESINTVATISSVSSTMATTEVPSTTTTSTTTISSATTEMAKIDPTTTEVTTTTKSADSKPEALSKLKSLLNRKFILKLTTEAPSS